MPEIKLFYSNCDCCVSSGSSQTGSGSNLCNCFFVYNFQDDTTPCWGVFNPARQCKKNFVVNINLSFAGCNPSPIGSCSSASSGAETGFDGPSTGSASDCLTECPDCCNLIDSSYELNLVCVGNTLTTENLIDGSCGSSADFESGSFCLGKRKNKCTYFYITADGPTFYGQFFIPIDNWGLGGFIQFPSVFSCDPFVMGGGLNFGRDFAPVLEPCLANCLNGLDPVCISGFFTITEAMP
jgi:hypothetical protein